MRSSIYAIIILYYDSAVVKVNVQRVAMTLDGSSSLQVLLQLCRVLVVESSSLLVELHVAFVDVVHIFALIERTTSTILGALLNPAGTKLHIRFILTVLDSY